MVVSREREQLRSSVASVEVAVSIGLVMAWLFGALALSVALPSGPQYERQAGINTLRGIQLADQRVIGPRRYRFEHHWEPRGERKLESGGFIVAAVGSIGTAAAGAEDCNEPVVDCQARLVRESD